MLHKHLHFFSIFAPCLWLYYFCVHARSIWEYTEVWRSGGERSKSTTHETWQPMMEAVVEAHDSVEWSLPEMGVTECTWAHERVFGSLFQMCDSRALSLSKSQRTHSSTHQRDESFTLVSRIITHTIHHCLLFACIDQVSFSLKGSYYKNENLPFVQCVCYTERDISDNVRFLVWFSDNPSSDKCKYSITICYSWATGFL